MADERARALAPFPVTDSILDLVEHALNGALDDNHELVGAEFSLHQLLDFLSGYDPAKVEQIGEDIYKYVGGPLYHYTDIIRALIAEVRRLRPQETDR